METVGQALVDMRDSVDPRVTLEVALIRLAIPGRGRQPGRHAGTHRAARTSASGKRSAISGPSRRSTGHQDR